MKKSQILEQPLHDVRLRFYRALHEPVGAQIDRTPKDPTGYIARHETAWATPRVGFEWALVNGIKSLCEYAVAHEAEYGTPLADDGVLGPAWLDALRGLRYLLNGELGRLDGGFLDGAICALYREAGYDGEL